MIFPRQAQGLRPQLSTLTSINKGIPYAITGVRHASHSNKHKKGQGMRASEAKSRSDSHEAVFGKRMKPFWKSITPDVLKDETRTSSNRYPTGGHFAQAASFQWHSSHKAGSKPVVEASTSSWDSKSNEVRHSVYDPISGRMIPESNGQSRQIPTSTGHNQGSDVPVKIYQKPSTSSQLAEHDLDLPNTHIARAAFDEDFGKVYQSEREELLAARRHLEVLREQVQILERQAHPSLTRPDQAPNEERPAVFEDGWDTDPKGLQTAYQSEKEACEHGDIKSLELELAALNKGQIQHVNDDYPITPIGMQTLFAHEQEVNDIAHTSSLEQEMVAMNSQAPRVDDGFGIEPFGLETLYHKENENTPAKLEHELVNSASVPATQIPDDGYSTKPIGMQTLYEREEADHDGGQRQGLEQELHEQLQPPVSTGGHPPEPQYMQNSYEREQEQVENGSTESLEEEIQTRQRPVVHSDGYSNTPSGMETLFDEERTDTGAGNITTLENEILRQAVPQTHDDVCSRTPFGLQTAFDKERKDVKLGTRHPLEQEMNTPEPSFEDGYSTMPMGLQMLFRREKHDAAQGNRLSLEEDIQQRDVALHHEDGYTCAPMGMQDSFEKEDKVGCGIPEAELPGEGDLSPTVGKFATSNHNRWYKQPAKRNLSEHSLKADNGLDALANDFSRAIHGHDDKYLDSSYSKSSSDREPTALNDTTSEHTPIRETSINNEQTSHPDILCKTDNTDPSSSVDPANKTTNLNIAWADPPVYKVIAYDSGKDAISITTTTTNFASGDSPISIPDTLSKLSQAGRFIPHLASIQNEGFQAIHASNDFLVLRKIDKDSRSRSSKLGGGAINPVDGTSRLQDIEPPMARFASPTGFVNDDPIFPLDPVTQAEDVPGTVYDIPTHARQSAEDRFFLSDKEQHDNQSSFNAHDSGTRRSGRWRRRFTWVLSVAMGTAACTYAVGVSNEMARPEKHVMRSSR